MREFFKGIAGDIRNWFVGLVMGGIALVAYPLIAALVKAIRSQPIPWTVFGIMTAVGVGFSGAAVWLLFSQHAKEKNRRLHQPLPQDANRRWEQEEKRILRIMFGDPDENDRREKAIEECLERYSKLLSNSHLMAECLIKADAHKLKRNHDLITLCNRIESFGNHNPLDHWRGYVPDDDALAFLQKLAYGPERFPDNATPSTLHAAMEKWRADHCYPEPPVDRQLDAIADKVLGFIPRKPIPPFRVTALDSNIEGDQFVTHLLFQNDSQFDRTVFSIRVVYWAPNRVWHRSYMFLGHDAGSMRLGDISKAFVLPANTKQTVIHRIEAPKNFLNVPNAEIGVHIVTGKEKTGEPQDVSFQLMKVISAHEPSSGMGVNYALHSAVNIDLDAVTLPSESTRDKGASQH